MENESEIKISATEYWVKIVEFLQQNWALIEPNKDGVTIYFFSDTSGVFDTIDYPSKELAEEALKMNWFSTYLDPTKDFTKFIGCPKPPFHWEDHSNGKIYSSGRFWMF